MEFFSTNKLGPPTQPSALWLSFVGDKLCCVPDGGARYLPFTSKIADDFECDLVSLGTIDGQPVYCASLAESVVLPADVTLVGLRALHSRVDAEWFAPVALGTQLLHFAQGYRYCPSCMHKLVPSVETRARECAACKRHWFPRVAPCVIVLVHDGERLLMTRQPRFPAGMYGLVAGFVEAYESLESCVDREVFEECGVRVKNMRYFSSQPWPFPEQLMVGYFAEYAGGELKADREELEDAQWFSVHDLPSLPPPISIARAMIDAFIAQHR